MGECIFISELNLLDPIYNLKTEMFPLSLGIGERIYGYLYIKIGHLLSWWYLTLLCVICWKFFSNW